VPFVHASVAPARHSLFFCGPAVGHPNNQTKRPKAKHF
jgi:hypothetical protein